MLPIVYLNGEYLDKADAHLHVSDLAILRGFGIFDYFRYIDAQPRFMTDHLARFRNSAQAMGLELPLSDAALAAVVRQLIIRNQQPDGGIRFVMTGGYAEDGYTPTSPNLIAMGYPHKNPPQELFDEGCSVLLHRYERQSPRVKTTDYIEGIRLLPKLKATRTDFPLYIDRDDNIRESDRSNIFIVKTGTLFTPADDVLLGITRKHLIALARELDIKLVEKTISRQEFLTADEAIIASSTKGAMPIVGSNEGRIGTGAPGPITLRLMSAWPAYCLGK